MKVVINGSNQTHLFSGYTSGAIWAICDSLLDEGYHYVVRTNETIVMGNR